MRPISRSEVMAELADVWEGNPRLTLYELFDVLRRAGVAPDSTNYEALSLCSYLTSLRPARVPLTPQGQATTPALVIMGTGRMRCALYPDYFIFYGDGRQLFARRYRRICSARLHQPLRLVDDGGTEWCDADEPVIAIEMIDTIPDPTAPYVFMFEDENVLGFWYQGRLRVEQRGRRSIDITEYQFPLVRAPRVGDDTPAGIIRACFKAGNGVGAHD